MLQTCSKRSSGNGIGTGSPSGVQTKWVTVTILIIVIDRIRSGIHITISCWIGKGIGSKAKEELVFVILISDFFTDILNSNQAAWREIVALGVTNGIPVPAFSASLSYYDSYRSEVLPANLLQAQRDFFGAHTYERTDKPAGEFFHTKWPELIEG